MHNFDKVHMVPKKHEKVHILSHKPSDTLFTLGLYNSLVRHPELQIRVDEPEAELMLIELSKEIYEGNLRIDDKDVFIYKKTKYLLSEYVPSSTSANITHNIFKQNGLDAYVGMGRYPHVIKMERL